MLAYWKDLLRIMLLVSCDYSQPYLALASYRRIAAYMSRCKNYILL